LRYELLERGVARKAKARAAGTARQGAADSARFSVTTTEPSPEHRDVSPPVAASSDSGVSSRTVPEIPQGPWLMALAGFLLGYRLGRDGRGRAADSLPRRRRR
jgi:hypothetical protein